MRTTIVAAAIAAAIGLVIPAPTVAQGPPSQAQNEKARGQGQGQGQAAARGQGQAQGQGQGQARARGQGQGQGQAAGRGGPPAHAAARRGGPAPDPETFNRNLVEKAVQTRSRRQGGAPAVRVERNADGVRVVDDGGRILFALSPETADDLGYWRAAVVPSFREDGYDTRRRDEDGGWGDIFGDDRYDYPDEEGAGSPAFCRSGAGHPVWGRDWCLDKGFGLGDRDRTWGVDRGLEDIILRSPDPRRDVLDRGGLIDVLGDVIFGRLAVQSLVLGADQPLSGRWIGQPEGPRTLRVTAGDLPVAELVDYDRDDSVDTILFNLGG
jgi:hypothetical protein